MAQQFSCAVWGRKNKKSWPCNRSAAAVVKLIAKVKVGYFLDFFLKITENQIYLPKLAL
jgi:hypothetical protein